MVLLKETACTIHKREKKRERERKREKERKRERKRKRKKKERERERERDDMNEENSKYIVGGWEDKNLGGSVETRESGGGGRR